MRNLISTLFLSQGVPMLLHGDEVRRTQHGNNNTYCQDNETSWMSWDWDDADEQMLEWTRRMIRFRQDHPVLRRARFFQGRPIRGTGVRDIIWYRPLGRPMDDQCWQDPENRVLGMYLAGAAADIVDSRGRPIVDDTILVLLNGGTEDVTFRLPPVPRPYRWLLAFDTWRPQEPDGRRSYGGRARYLLSARSISVLRHPPTQL
jgi:glycogen operon protein